MRQWGGRNDNEFVYFCINFDEGESQMKVTSKQAYEWVKTGHWSFRQFKEWTEDSDYAYPTIQDYEETVGFNVGDAFEMGFTMARTTNEFIQQLGGE